MHAMISLSSLVAQTVGGGGHPWAYAGGWGWPFGPLLGLVWLLVIVGALWLVVRAIRPRERSGLERAREILAERLARGEIGGDEYRQRLEQLR